jgi:hypothetical protein
LEENPMDHIEQDQSNERADSMAQDEFEVSDESLLRAAGCDAAQQPPTRLMAPGAPCF